MTAPWKPAVANRDPFAAFICDDATLDQLRPVATELGFAPEKCIKGGLRTAVQSLSVAASPAILLIDLSECGDPLNDINALAEVCEPGTVVIALGRVNDVRLYRQLMASGIHDYLLKPVSAGQLEEALTQGRESLTAPRPTGPEPAKSHTATAVIGTRGGVGASMLATSLGWLFAADHKLPTALLDLDVHFGTAALSLDLEPGRGLIDAIANPSRIDGLFIERAMVKAGENLSVLSAEAPINSPIMTDGAAFYQLQEEMRVAFECTIVDLPRGMLVQHPHLVAELQVAVIVTEMTLAAARDTIRLLSWLKSNAPMTQIVVVANKVLPAAALEISRKDFEGSIERKIDYIVPLDQKLAAQAAKLGKTVAEAGKTSKTVAPLIEIATQIMSVGDTEGVVAPGRKKKLKGDSLLGKFGDLKAMMPKRAPKKK